jgi:hypothetical protein
MSVADVAVTACGTSLGARPLPCPRCNRIQASLADDHGNVTAVARALKSGTASRPLDLARTGQGLCGEDSSEYLRQLRNEWP